MECRRFGRKDGKAQTQDRSKYGKPHANRWDDLLGITGGSPCLDTGPDCSKEDNEENARQGDGDTSEEASLTSHSSRGQDSEAQKRSSSHGVRGGPHEYLIASGFELH